MHCCQRDTLMEGGFVTKYINSGLQHTSRNLIGLMRVKRRSEDPTRVNTSRQRRRRYLLEIIQCHQWYLSGRLLISPIDLSDFQDESTNYQQ